jgi:hypothetical protein
MIKNQAEVFSIPVEDNENLESVGEKPDSFLIRQVLQKSLNPPKRWLLKLTLVKRGIKPTLLRITSAPL